MTIQLWPDKKTVQVDRKGKLFLAFSFWSLLATRIAVGNGQTTLIVFTLMLLTLLMIKKNWFLAGLALGVALSKYSLSVPILLFLVFKREYRIVALSLLTQLIGLISLSLMTNTAPLQVFNEYILMLKLHLDNPGINLASILPNSSSLTIPLIITFSISVLAITSYWLMVYYRRMSVQDKSLSEYHILVILSLLTLLVVYHREYDAVLIILFINLVVFGLSSNRWRISGQKKNGLILLLFFSLLWMCRPGSITRSILPTNLAQLWLNASEDVATILLCMSLVLTIVMLYRISSTNNIFHQNHL
jgi:hypothetical protein